MPEGKPAHVRCIQLDDENLCRLFGDPRRPKVCLDFKAGLDVCGRQNEFAFKALTELETQTR
jgi:hypothetical protein